MKSIFTTLTTVGTAAATVVLTSAAAFAQDPATPGAQPGSPSYQKTESQTQTQFEGRIVSLFDYLAGQQAASSQSASSASPSAIPSSARSAQDVTSTEPKGTEPKGTERSTDVLGRDRRDSTSPSGAFSGTAAWAGQPLALVVQSQSSISSPASTPSTSTPPPTDLSTPSSGSAIRSSSAGGEVYVLVFDPQDANSRSAFTKAQWMASGRPSGSETTSDRLPVRGVGESDPSRQPAATPARDSDLSKTDPSKNDLSRSDPSRVDPIRNDPSKSDSIKVYASTHSVGGKHVKITGKVLQKGGIMAIEVASVEDVLVGAPSSGTSGLRGTPRN